MEHLPALLHRLLAPIATGALIVAGIGLAQPAFAEQAAATPASVQQIQRVAVANANADTGTGTAPADDADPDSTFDPGFIISDYNFFNSHAMTERDIQSFLEAQDCSPRDGSPCLADYRQDTSDEPADAPGHCTHYDGAFAELASRIIAKVALACGISPRVLLVTLQKEQSLVSRPSASGYLHATGYGCPDTAACDSEYFGFFNQVYRAAWQFRQYTQYPERQYAIGGVQVRFHPNTGCGSSLVTIKNQATADLYNYTPYQPDDAALDDLGVDGGDGCSTHGNLNFWMLYNSWFGSSTSVRYPLFFDSCLNLVGGQPCTETQPLPAS